MHNFIRDSGTMPKFQENTQIDVRREGWTDPILQSPSSYHQGYNKYNCSRLIFKSQRYRQYDAALTKHYCITVSMQKISSIHKYIQWVSCTKWPCQFFDHAHPKIIEITFSFPALPPACKKSAHSINSFFKYSQFQSPVTRLATPIPKFFDQLLIFMSICINMQKIRPFHSFGLEIWLVQKSCNLIG